MPTNKAPVKKDVPNTTSDGGNSSKKGFYEDVVLEVVKKIQSEPFLFVIGIAALLAGVVIASAKLGSPDVRYVITIVALLAGFALLGYWVSDIIRSYVKRPPEGTGTGTGPGTGPGAYGLTFDKIVWINHYLTGGDFEGRIEYSVRNTSSDDVVDLPPCPMAWLGWNIEQPKVSAEIFGAGKGKYVVTLGDLSASKEKRTDLDGTGREVTSYWIQPFVKPDLEPRGSLDYAVKVETKGTEKEAFNPGGSFAGMRSPYQVAELRCDLYAPEGYRFGREMYYVRDRAGNTKDPTGVSRPEFSDGDRKVTWSIKESSPSLQYLMKVVIVKAD